MSRLACEIKSIDAFLQIICYKKEGGRYESRETGNA